MSSQTATVPLVLSDATEQTPSGALAAAFHLSKTDLEWFARKPTLFSPSRGAGAATLKVSVYAGRKGTTCGVSSGRLLGKASGAPRAWPAVLHSDWISIGGKAKAAELSLTVRVEPDPRFVFEFDGEPECSPQVMQVRGAMRQPMFTCKFGCRANSYLLRRRSVTEAAGKERKGWSVTVHDLSGSPVALASMVTPFVASPGTDRVSRSNPGAWLILRPTGEDDGAWEPWGRLECWRDSLGYRFDVAASTNPHLNSDLKQTCHGAWSSVSGGAYASARFLLCGCCPSLPSPCIAASWRSPNSSTHP